MTKSEIDERKMPPKQGIPYKRTFEEEQEQGLGDFDPASSDEE